MQKSQNQMIGMKWLAQFPVKEDLITMYPDGASEAPLKVNNHIHSPYSFSAFRDMEQSVRMADEEDVRVLGINDFYVTDGYDQFITTCRKYGVFPLLNIELIGISRQEQKNGIRVNDPNNPGRTYISGKGLAFPVDLPQQQREKLDRVVEESNRQVEQMIDLLNQWLIKKGVDISLSVDEIMQKHAFRLLRERHVAKALRVKLEEQAENEKELNKLISRTVGGDLSDFAVSNIAALEDELRARLLKSGGPAYVPEDERAFLSLEEILELIRDAGGIPTYPLLLDGAKGHITEFENDPERLRKILEDRAIHAVEFIPLRNSFEKLKEYSEYFYGHGFTVSFGTEHNTTSMKPLTVFCKGNIPLDGELMRISYNGVATIAAHQYLTARGEKSGKPESRKEMEQLGHAVIQHYLKIFLPSTPAGAI